LTIIDSDDKLSIMAEIYTFTPKQKSTEENVELNRLRAKLLELHEIRDTLNKEIRYTKDAINLLEKGEK
jgi:ribosome-interacting GTPase 1